MSSGAAGDTPFESPELVAIQQRLAEQILRPLAAFGDELSRHAAAGAVSSVRDVIARQSGLTEVLARYRLAGPGVDAPRLALSSETLQGLAARYDVGTSTGWSAVLASRAQVELRLEEVGAGTAAERDGETAGVLRNAVAALEESDARVAEARADGDAAAGTRQGFIMVGLGLALEAAGSPAGPPVGRALLQHGVTLLTHFSG